jgi:ATP adenylyltransferase
MEKLWAPWRLEYIQGPEADRCVFCLNDDSAEDQSRLVLMRGEHSFVIMNRFPYSNGHLMVAPYRHIGEQATLEREEVWETHSLMVLCQDVLREVCSAQGFNIGWNIGQVAGAGIADHIHLHVVPRWQGDTNFMPVLADVRVVPQHLDTTWNHLRRAFDERKM